MREITFHKVGGDSMKLLVIDEPGQGGACHEYRVDADDQGSEMLAVHFQNGPIQEVGVNGVQQEHLLAIVIDRLRAFQAGPFACRTNAIALTKCEEALMWLQSRTRDRMARQVEGFNKA